MICTRSPKEKVPPPACLTRTNTSVVHKLKAMYLKGGDSRRHCFQERRKSGLGTGGELEGGMTGWASEIRMRIKSLTAASERASGVLPAASPGVRASVSAHIEAATLGKFAPGSSLFVARSELGFLGASSFRSGPEERAEISGEWRGKSDSTLPPPVKKTNQQPPSFNLKKNDRTPTTVQSILADALQSPRQSREFPSSRRNKPQSSPGPSCPVLFPIPSFCPPFAFLPEPSGHQYHEAQEGNSR